MNIVLVILDSMRATHLGCYGYRGTDTPMIDQLAAEGVLFEQAFCQAPNTWVSHASILTGCHPNAHGLRQYLSSLNPQISRLAEVLQKAGYATAGYPAHSLVGSARGFERGFDIFDEEDMLHTSAMGHGLKQNRAWEPTLKKAFQWMLNQQQPFFVWFHYMGTHWEPPGSLSVPEAYRLCYSPAGQFYDAKISYADQVCIGALVSFLTEHRMLDDTIIVVTADHGEEDLCKIDNPPYQNQGHNNGLNEQVMRVPLIIRAPALIPSDLRIPHVVRLIDIMPTLLNMVGIEWTYLNLDGVDLTPLWSPKPNSMSNLSNLRAYMENAITGYAGVRTDTWKLVLRVGPPPPRRTLRQRAQRRLRRMIYQITNSNSSQHPSTLVSKYRFTDWVKQVTEGLYAIAKDPWETDNLSGNDCVADIERELETYILQMVRQTELEQPELSPDEEAQIMQSLINLGYLEPTESNARTK